MKKNVYLILGIITLLVLIVGVNKKAEIQKFLNQPKDIGIEAAKSQTLDFVKNNLVQPGTDVSIKDITEENGLYKINLTVGKQTVETYLTKDGSKFFPQAMDVAQAGKQNQDTDKQAEAQKDIPKSEIPDVRLFVMSYCPYGTQMEKGILPVLDALKDKIKFQLEFVDYSMHNSKATNDRKELDENLRQYCIEKDDPGRLSAYLDCFLKKGQGTESSCLESAGINATQTNLCMKAADTQFNVTKNFNDESSYQGNFPQFEVNKGDNKEFGVQGSPTLIINGVEAKTQRDPASILKTICSAFNNQPEGCASELSSTAPAPGFGEGTGSGSNASCGN
jgi:hypothetical protein